MKPITWNALKRSDWWIALGLAVVYITILVKTSGAQGYARDEGFYFAAAESYSRWFEILFRDPSTALHRAAVDASFTANHEHPGLVKSLFSLSWMFLYKRFHLFREEGTSFRFPGMCFAGLTLFVLYLWGTEAKSRRTGLIAALLFALVPTTFYHAHLDCFDVPIAAMWLVTAWAYWKSRKEGGYGWALATGISFGLSLDTKHNSWFLPIAVVLHTVLSRGFSLRRDILVNRFRAPLALVFMVLLGPPIFVLLWPWLWFDTAARFFAYVTFHTHHDYYNIEFLGKTYFEPPFPHAYAWLMTAATVPIVTLALSAAGMWKSVKQRFLAADRVFDPTSLHLLWAIGLLVNYGPWLSSGTPIFGGTKHWLAAYPFLMLFAGLGFDSLSRVIEEHFVTWKAPQKSAAVTMLSMSVLAAPAYETFHAHPWGLSAYTPLVGGAQGAATLGLNRGFWGYTTGSVVRYLNNSVPRNGTVYIHDTAWDSWRMLQRDGRLREDIRAVGTPAGADAALYHHEQHMEGVEYQEWVSFGTTAPSEIAGLDGVPVIWVYSRTPASPR